MIDIRAIKETLDTPQEEFRVNKMWREIEHRRHFQPAIPRPLQVAGIAFVAVCIVSLSILFLGKSSGPLLLKDGTVLPAVLSGSGPLWKHFADDSSLQIHKDTVLEVLDNSDAAVRFSLRRGKVGFEVTPGGKRKWQIYCGFAEVEVVGTSFVLVKKAEVLEVSVTRGVVLVKGNAVPGGVQKLEAGKMLVVHRNSDHSLSSLPHQDVQSRTTNDQRELPGSMDTLPDPSTEVQQIGTEVEDARNNARNVWKEHAKRGDYAEAYNELGTTRHTALSKRAKTAKELFALADVARLGGHPKQAVLPLKTIVDDYSTDSRAGLAAYTLARLYMEQFSWPKRAADMFQKAVDLGLPIMLTETSLAKKVEACSRFDRQLAKVAGDKYLTKYPTGRYRKRVESWVSQGHSR